MKHIQEIYRAGDKLPAVQMINKAAGSAGAADPFDELQTTAWKSWHAAKVLNINWTCNVQSAASALAFGGRTGHRPGHWLHPATGSYGGGYAGFNAGAVHRLPLSPQLSRTRT